MTEVEAAVTVAVAVAVAQPEAAMRLGGPWLAVPWS